MSHIVFQPRRCRHRALTGAPVAVVLALLLAACQMTGQCDPGTSAAAAPREASDKLMRVADETRAHGDPATALGLYRRLHETRPSDPEPLARIGSPLAQLQDYGNAAQAYREAIALAPNDPALRRGLASVLLSLGQPEPAIAELEIAIAKRPDDPHLLNALGVAHAIPAPHHPPHTAYRNCLPLVPPPP